MGNYRIPKNVTSELKINKALYLKDLMLLIGVLITTMMFQNIVHSSFRIAFYVFMIIVAGLLIIRPATNPKKRMYEAIFLALRRRKETYTAIDYEINESDIDNENLKEVNNNVNY